MIEQYPPGYETVRNGLRAFADFYNRMEVTGLEHIPPVGTGALVCCNHDNYSDPFYLGIALKERYMRFLAWGDIFTWGALGKFVESMGAVPVPTTLGRANDKAGASAALETLAEHIRQGELCAIFPEGRIKHWVGSDALTRFKPGAARVAAMAGAPIVPAALYGTRWAVPNVVGLGGFKPAGTVIDVNYWAPIPLPSKVLVKFGEPMDVDPKAATDTKVAIREVERLRKRIFALRQELKHRYKGPLGR